MTIRRIVFQPAMFRRISAAIGGTAVVTALAMSACTASHTPTVDDDAHEKFEVVTVIAKTPESPPATVTETDKPHQLLTPRATPRVRADRTVMVQP